MRIEARGCVIRSFRPEDAPSLAANANHWAVWSQLRDSIPHPYTVNDAVEFIELMLRQRQETAFAIDVAGEAVGSIGITFQTDINRHTAEIGYWLGRPYWGGGIATQAVQAVSGWALDRFPLMRIFAVPFADNPASCRVLEKAGFVFEGRMRCSAVKDGRVKDQLVFALVP